MNSQSWGLIVVSLVMQGLLPVFQQRLMAKAAKNGAALNFVTTSTIATIFLGAFVTATGFSRPTSWGAILGYMAATTVLYALANVCIFQSFRGITPGIFAQVFTVRLVVVTVGAVILGEVLNGWNKLGIALILASVVGATLVWQRSRKVIAATRAKSLDQATDEDDGRDLSPFAGLMLALIGTIFFGAANALDAKIVQTFEPQSYLLFRLALPALVVAIVARVVWVRKGDVGAYLRSVRVLPLLGMSLCIVISSATFMMAYRVSHQLALLSGVHQFSLFFTIGFSALVNREERQHIGAYLIAAIVAIGGVALMRWA